MKNKFIFVRIFSNFAFAVLLATLFFSIEICAQKNAKATGKTSAGKIKATKTNKAAAQKTNLPKVTQIDRAGLANLLKRGTDDTKPLLVNFWATWCDPCREEFPDLVKIDAEYKDKIDFATISIDDLAEIDRDVPKFLSAMNATMPAYLLKTDDEEAAIASVARDWKGGMPFTVLFSKKGEIVYSRQGKVELVKLRAAIEKLVSNQTAKLAASAQSQ